MGFYLVREDEVIKRYGMRQWPAIIRLVRAYKWKPKQSGNYDTMSGQLVSTEDANSMADALERALVHFPNVEAELKLELQVKTGLWRPPNESEEKELQLFLEHKTSFGDNRILIDLIEFCREGEFRIH